jgi:hypothetical protein
MPLPDVLPRALTATLTEDLMAATLAYCDISDVSRSRFIQRAVGRELDRLKRKDPQLQKKIERAIKNGKGKSTRNDRAK